MSFKREGDDLSQLNLLKKRRVSDLLAEDIPEDEAFLMRSGRYACTVCHHRPVFDTIAMLQVHRNGKKHLTSVKSYYTKKQNLMKEIEKRRQLLSLSDQQEDASLGGKATDETPLLTKTKKAAHHALLKATPYKGYAVPSTIKGSDNQSGGGKTSQDTKASFFQRLNDHHSHHKPTATRSHSLPGNRSLPPGGQSNVTIPTTHNAKRSQVSQSDGPNGDRASNTNASRTSVDETGHWIGPLTIKEKRASLPFQLQPYVPKHLRKTNLQEIKGCEPQSSTSSKKEAMSSSKHGKETEDLPTSKPSVILLTNRVGSCDFREALLANPEKQTDTIPPAKHTKDLPSKGLKEMSVKPMKDSSQKPQSILEDSQRSDRGRYLHFTSSGWKPDWKGGWVQDQDVEFDSDEEEPA